MTASTSALQLKFEASGQEDGSQSLISLTDVKRSPQLSEKKKKEKNLCREWASFGFSSSTLRNHIFQLQ